MGETAQFEPEVYGKYYLVDKIAVGGMAEIFKAQTYSHGGFEKTLVIKRILAHLTDNEDFISMFIDEAKISVSLQHANIVQIYDFGKLFDNYFIAMEWVDGKDVKQILRKLAGRRKLLPEEYAVFIAHEAAKALDYAHKKRNMKGEALDIIHRDVSPSNVLVSYDAEVKMADFGIAKAGFSAYNTKDGVLKGKFEYMSPEQARGESVSQQSDLFSLGIILYEMLTGRRLFKTDSEIKTLEKIKSVDIGPPSSLNPNIPPRLDAIVMRALSADQEDRYIDAAAFQAALLEYMYPGTPTVTQKSLELFMQELFSEERGQEVDRLQRGSELAKDLHTRTPDLDLDPEWEEEATELPKGVGRITPGAGTNTTATIAGQPSSDRGRILAAGVIVLLLGLLLWSFFGRTHTASVTPTPEPQTVEPAVPTTGAVTLRIEPDGALVFLDEVQVGSGGEVKLPEVEPGERTLRVSAEGYETQEHSLDVAAGREIVLPITLDRTPDPRPDATAGTVPGTTDADAFSVRFESDPPGASVYVDNRTIGRTPMTWTEGVRGESYLVRYAREGYEAATFDLAIPDEGPSSTQQRSLKKRAAALGKLNLNTTKGWGYVYIDGKRLSETTPLAGYELSAGHYTVRVVNESFGLDQTKQVTVKANETTKVVVDFGD